MTKMENLSKVLEGIFVKTRVGYGRETNSPYKLAGIPVRGSFKRYAVSILRGYPADTNVAQTLLISFIFKLSFQISFLLSLIAMQININDNSYYALCTPKNI